MIVVSNNADEISEKYNDVDIDTTIITLECLECFVFLELIIF
jgi:hypothetical protein